MGRKAFFAALCWLAVSGVFGDKISVKSAVALDNESAESAPRLYRNVPVGIYASAVPYGSYSFHMPRFVSAPHAAASQVVQVKQEGAPNNGYLKDSYGNRFAETPLTYGYKTAFTQQFLPLQKLPDHLAQPLVGASANFQFKQTSPQVFVGSPYRVPALQGPTPTPINQFPGFSQQLVYADKVKGLAVNSANPFGAPNAQQQSSNNNAVFASSYQPFSGFKSEPKFQRIQDIPRIVYGEPKYQSIQEIPKLPHGENKFQRLKESPSKIHREEHTFERYEEVPKQQEVHNDNAPLQAVPAKKTVTYVSDVNGKTTVVKLKTDPPIPLLDLTLLEPLTFENPLVPQVQHFLPRIHQATYQKLPQAIPAVPQQKKPTSKAKSNNTPRKTVTHHETLDEVPEIVSYEIDQPNYKETVREKALSYNRETTTPPEHYSYGSKSENEPVTYSYSRSSKEPENEEIRFEEPDHLVYQLSPEEQSAEQEDAEENAEEEESESQRETSRESPEDGPYHPRPEHYNKESPKSSQQHHEQRHEPEHHEQPHRQQNYEQRHESDHHEQPHRQQNYEQRHESDPHEQPHRQQHHEQRHESDHHEQPHRQQHHEQRHEPEHHEQPHRQQQEHHHQQQQHHHQQHHELQNEEPRHLELQHEEPEHHYKEEQQNHYSKPQHLRQETPRDVEVFNSEKNYPPKQETVHHYDDYHAKPREYEEDIRLTPPASGAAIKVDPNQHKQHEQPTSQPHPSPSPHHEDRERHSHSSAQHRHPEPSSTPQQHSQTRPHSQSHPSPTQSYEPYSPPESDHHHPPPSHIHEKSKRIIIKEETPESMHMLAEKMREEMIQREENSEEDFEKAYKDAAIGFPNYAKAAEEIEKNIYNPASYGVPPEHLEYNIEHVPFQQYQDQSDDFPKTTRLSYKDARDKTKENYYADYKVSKPESLNDRYKNKEGYYKLYRENKPDYLSDSEENVNNKKQQKQKSAKYTAAPSHEYPPQQKAKSYYGSYKPKQQLYGYDYPKAPHDSSAYASRPLQMYKIKTNFVEPQFQYGFEPLTIPKLLDSELSAMASNLSPESEKPGMRKKIYKENWYIKQTTTTAGDGAR